MAGQPLQPLKVKTMYHLRRLREVSISVKNRDLAPAPDDRIYPMLRDFNALDVVTAITHLNRNSSKKLFDNILTNQAYIIEPTPQCQTKEVSAGDHAFSVQTSDDHSSGTHTSGDLAFGYYYSNDHASNTQSSSYLAEEEYKPKRSSCRDRYKKSEDDKMKHLSANYRSASHDSKVGHENQHNPHEHPFNDHDSGVHAQSPHVGKNKRSHSQSSSSSSYSTSRSSSPSCRRRRKSRNKSSRHRHRQSRRASHKCHLDAYPTPSEYPFGKNFHPVHGQPPHPPPEAMHYPHSSHHMPYYPPQVQTLYPVRMPPPGLYGGPMYYPPRKPLPVYNNRPLPKFVTVTVTATTGTITTTTVAPSTDINRQQTPE